MIGDAGVVDGACEVHGFILQNGPDAVALYEGRASEFPRGTPPRRAGLIDAVVYGTDDPESDELLEVLTPGGVQVNESAIS